VFLDIGKEISQQNAFDVGRLATSKLIVTMKRNQNLVHSVQRQVMIHGVVHCPKYVLTVEFLVILVAIAQKFAV
jgi:hypothetical protein